METKRKKTSLLIQVIILFVIGILVTGSVSYFSSRNVSDVTVKSQIEQRADEAASAVEQCIKEYPTYQWLLRYYYEHADDMDVEYDVDYETGTKTEKKCQTLLSHQPGFQIKYADTADVEALPKEDQKLYAEITYSWIITSLNQIKRSNHIDFLFCVVTDKKYSSQFFLFSAADEGAVRGTTYGEVYPLGWKVTVTEGQQSAMESACQSDSYLTEAGDYMDYYSFFDKIDGQDVLLGMTYSVSLIKSNIMAQTLREIAMTTGMQIILLLLCLWLLFQVVLKPLQEVQKNIRTYKETKDSKATVKSLDDIQSNNEIGQLSDDITDLVNEIDNYIKTIEDITIEEERIKAELNVSRQIQESMMPCTFPAFPERVEFDIHATMEPAREVGGDFYDFYMIDEDHLGIVIADVSGKGIPAALFMMISKIIVKSFAMTDEDAGEILTKTNEAICGNNESEMFVTMWVGVLEISTGKVRAANAGHEYPALKHSDGVFEVVRNKHGLVVGAMEGMKYVEYTIQMEPGDKLFLYTDGLTEATDDQNNMFGMERMLVALNKDTSASPKEIIANVRASVDDFVQEAQQFDDLTMLCLEYKGK